MPYLTTSCGIISGVVVALNYQGHQRFVIVSFTVLTFALFGAIFVRGWILLLDRWFTAEPPTAGTGAWLLFTSIVVALIPIAWLCGGEVFPSIVAAAALLIPTMRLLAVRGLLWDSAERAFHLILSPGWLLVSVLTGIICGFFSLLLGFPTILAMLIGNELHQQFGISTPLGWGLAMGLIHAIPGAFTTSYLASRRSGVVPRYGLLLPMTVSVTSGLLSGIVISSALWVAFPLNQSPQGPAMLHVGNFLGIVFSALITPFVIWLFARRIGAEKQQEQSTPLAYRPRAITRLFLAFVLSLGPILALSGSVFVTQAYWNPVAWNMKRLDSHDDYIRSQAVYELAAHADSSNSREIFQAIANKLSDRDFSVRKATLKSLPEFGSQAETALPKIREFLTNDSPQLRVEAAKAIWKISGETETLELVVVGALKEFDEVAKKPPYYSNSGRDEAALLLAEISPEHPMVGAALARTAVQGHPNQQKRAIDRLNQLGKEGLAAAIPNLHELSQSKNPTFAKQANEVLRQLRIPDKGSDPLNAPDTLSKRQTMNQDNESE